MSDGAMIELEIDGRSLSVPPGTSVWDAARAAGIEIPVLCHDARLAPVGVCRVCVVDVGERVLAAACVRECEPGMVVKTATEEVEQHRKQLVELLMADQPAVADDAREQTLGDGELRALPGRRQLAALP